MQCGEKLAFKVKVRGHGEENTANGRYQVSRHPPSPNTLPIKHIQRGSYGAGKEVSPCHLLEGVGLYMSKVFIEDHLRGRIEARNVDDGVELRIIIPLAHLDKD